MAKEVLDHFRDRFINEMDANDVVMDLLDSDIISEGVKNEITRNTDPMQQNRTLHLTLKKTCTREAFKKACDIISKVRGNPKMGALGVDMKRRLETDDASSTVGALPIIPDIKDDYIEVKGVFVNVCTTQGSPTLDEVKSRCIDLIKGALTHIPRIRHYEDDITNAKTMAELACVVCFDLSNWISYDFFKKVIAHFQPALRSVKERLLHYEDQLKPLLQQKLQYIEQLQQQEELPGSLAELTVKYRLDADGLHMKDLATERDFLAQRLGIPDHLLQVLSWGKGSITIIYWIMRDVLPLAELALCREVVRAELTQHGVEAVYLDRYPSEHSGPVDQSLQTVHLQRRAIVTVLDAHRDDMDVTSLTSDLKSMGIVTAEQSQKLASLDDKERRHEALLYILLAHDGPDTYHKLLEHMRLRVVSIVVDLQATFKDLMTSPRALSVFYGSHYTPRSPEERVASHVVEAMRSEASLPMEQPALTEGFMQPQLKEERLEDATGELKGGQSSQDEGVSHFQPGKDASRMEVLEGELAETREAKENEMKKQMVESKQVQGETDDWEIQYLELEVRYSELQERYSKLQERHRYTEDKFELFKKKHADCNVTKMEQQVGALCNELTDGLWT